MLKHSSTFLPNHTPTTPQYPPNNHSVPQSFNTYIFLSQVDNYIVGTWSEDRDGGLKPPLTFMQ